MRCRSMPRRNWAPVKYGALTLCPVAPVGVLEPAVYYLLSDALTDYSLFMHASSLSGILVDSTWIILRYLLRDL